MLYNKYRPKELEDIMGNDATLKSISKMKPLAHTFLFSGSAGTGKTTLARCLKNLIPCQELDIIEIDAATKSGVSEVEEIIAQMPYPGFGSGKKLYIFDECHMFSKSAWNSLLKTLEEPPKHVYIAMCTTELTKVPKAIITRSQAFKMSLLPDKMISALLEIIIKKEGLEEAFIYKNDQAWEYLVVSASGSPRQAISNLESVINIEQLKEIEELLRQAGEIPSVFEYCQDLISGKITVSKSQEYARNFKDLQNVEGIRLQIVNYLTSCILNGKNKEATFDACRLLSVFKDPIYETVGFPVLLLKMMSVFE